MFRGSSTSHTASIYSKKETEKLQWLTGFLYLHSFPKDSNGSCAVVNSIKCNALRKVDSIFIGMHI